MTSNEVPGAEAIRAARYVHDVCAVLDNPKSDGDRNRALVEMAARAPAAVTEICSGKDGWSSSTVRTNATRIANNVSWLRAHKIIGDGSVPSLPQAQRDVDAALRVTSFLLAHGINPDGGDILLGTPYRSSYVKANWARRAALRSVGERTRPLPPPQVIAP